ncbi:MAG: sigma-54-dependent Fis family transcriptional regulator [Gemmatimonadetes bacterium]|nr:sigma-54-dependent Fis family transcriptional regulator [Gemmatimonadota bacterium]
MKVLIIDDEPGLRQTVSLILGEEGFEAQTAADGEEGLNRAFEQQPDIILCDARMPRLTGLEFVERYTARGGNALVIVMTAYGSTELAIEAMRKGAYDYLPKPFSPEQLILTLRKAVEREALRREITRLREEVSIDRRYGQIIAKSPAMTKVLETAAKVAKHPSSVLITGESGTGKELIARLIHAESDRAAAPFVPVNCGAIPENLLESELFGYVRGAFTGADRDKPGLFEAANGGTVFLDEIAEMPMSLQVKLLRTLQEREVRRLGDTRTRPIDVRLISATNRDFTEEIRQNRFRQDLYYRIAVVPIHLVPLRQRREEIPLLVAHFIETYNRKLRLSVKGVESDAMRKLLEYPWPGNVRELENTIERAMVLAESPKLTVADLPPHIHAPVAMVDTTLPDDELSVKKHGAILERRLIQRALERTGGNKTRAADLLELSSRALLYKIREYGLE